MINKIEFSAKNLTSNAGLLLLLEHASKNGIFDLIDHDLVFENASTNKIKMNHIKTMLCGNFIGKGYPTLVARVTDPSITFGTGESGRETTEFVTTLNTWEKDRRFVVSRVLKDEKDRAQLSFLEVEEYDYFFFVTNTEQSSEEVVEFYEKRGNSENYIKEAKYDMAVGHLLLQSFWANEAIFQLMMLEHTNFLCSRWTSQAKQNTGSKSRLSV